MGRVHRSSSIVTSGNSKGNKSESALGERQEVTNKLLRSAIEHSCEWESVTKVVGNEVNPMDYKEKFMCLSVEEEVLAADPPCTGLMNSQQGVSPSLLSTVMGNENSLSTIPGPLICLLLLLVKGCRPEVLSAALSAAQKEVLRLNDEQHDNKQQHRSLKVEEGEDCVEDNTTSLSDIEAVG